VAVCTTPLTTEAAGGAGTWVGGVTLDPALATGAAALATGALATGVLATGPLTAWTVWVAACTTPPTAEATGATAGTPDEGAWVP
jgi:hypothetical protein